MERADEKEGSRAEERSAVYETERQRERERERTRNKERVSRRVRRTDCTRGGDGDVAPRTAPHLGCEEDAAVRDSLGGGGRGEGGDCTIITTLPVHRELAPITAAYTRAITITGTGGQH